MGGIIWSSTYSIENEIKELKQKLDTNKDGYVTRQELEEYFVEKIDQNKDGIIEEKELEEFLNQKDQEIAKWKNLYSQAEEKSKLMETEIHNLKSYISWAVDEDKFNQSYVSDVAIKQYIDDILSGDGNLKYVPDSIEARAYFTMYKTALESIEALCNSTNLQFMNHQIKVRILPQDLK